MQCGSPWRPWCSMLAFSNVKPDYLPASLILLRPEVLTEKRDNFMKAVGPRFGIPARRGTTPGGGIRVHPLLVVRDRPVAVEGVVSARINLNSDRITGLLGGCGQFTAGFRRGPVVVFSDENQQGSDGLVHTDVTRDRPLEPAWRLTCQSPYRAAQLGYKASAAVKPTRFSRASNS